MSGRLRSLPIAGAAALAFAVVVILAKRGPQQQLVTEDSASDRASTDRTSDEPRRVFGDLDSRHDSASVVPGEPAGRRTQEGGLAVAERTVLRVPETAPTNAPSPSPGGEPQSPVSVAEELAAQHLRLRREWSEAFSSAETAQEERALAAIESALHGDDQVAKRAALSVLAESSNRSRAARLNSVVIGLLSDEDGGVRVRAATVLRGTDVVVEAIERLAQRVLDDSVEGRAVTARVLAAISNGDLSIDAADRAIAMLLDDRDPVVRSETLAVLEASTVGVATVQRLVVIMRAPDFDRSMAVKLGRVSTRSDSLAREIVGQLASADSEHAAALLMALRAGVPAQSRAYAFDEVLRLITAARAEQVKLIAIDTLVSIDRARSHQSLLALRGSSSSSSRVDARIDDVLGTSREHTK